MNINFGMEDNTLQSTSDSIYKQNGEKEISGAVQNAENNGCDVKSLMPGQMFEGTVADIKGMFIKILLGNDMMLNAALQDDIKFRAGDSVTFEVKENTGGRLVIKPVDVSKIKGENDNFIQKVLDSVSLSSSDSNRRIVGELMRQGQPLDRQTILSAIKTAVKYPALDFSDIVTLNKNNIPITQDNVKMYLDFESGRNKITSYTNSVIDFIPEFAADIFDSEGKSGLIDFMKKLTGIIYSGNQNGDDLEPHNPAQTVSRPVTQNTEQYSEKNVINEAEQQTETVAKGETLTQAVVKGVRDIPHNIPENMFKNSYDNTYESMSEIMPENTHGSMPESTSEIMPENTLNMSQRMSEDKSQNIFQNMPAYIDDGSVELKDRLVNIIRDIPDVSVKDVLKSESFLSALKEAVEKNMYVTPGELVRQDNIKEQIMETLSRMDAKLKQLSMIVKDVSVRDNADTEAAKNIITNAQNAGDSLNFMNELNSHSGAYVQIPVKFANEDTAGELYVYNRNKNKTVQDGITAFLHFDLESLGATDIKIKLKGRGLTLSFDLSDSESVKLVNDNFEQLEDRLKEKGYNVNFTVRKRETEESVTLKDILNENSEETIKRYTFDIRT